MSQRTIKIVTIVSVLALFLCCVIWIGGSAVINWISQQNQDIAFSVAEPDIVVVDEPVLIIVTVENQSTEPRLLHSIDFSMVYLDAIPVENSDPPYSGTSLLPIGPEMKSFTFLQRIPAGEKLEVQFYGVARDVGIYPGEVNVCMESVPVCKTISIRTEIIQDHDS